MRIKLTILFFFLLALACKKPFTPPESEQSTEVLVVEGMIAVGDDAENKFILSRVKALGDSTPAQSVQGAVIQIESKSGRSWAIPETTPGSYSSVADIPENDEYRLKISTLNGNIYETPFLVPVNTPPIDSVTWAQEPKDLTLYVHTHDPSASTRYYRWDYVETWEYRAYYETFLEYVNGSVRFRDSSNLIYSCFRTRPSSSVIINNTLRLSEDRISYQPLNTIIYGSEELSERYSILVRQYGLTKEAYEFWDLLKKNTELTGSLFDPQPSQLNTNIICTNDPNQIAVGYVAAGKVRTQRIFIRYADLDDWRREKEGGCDVKFEGDFDVMQILSTDTSYAPAYYNQGLLGIAKVRCVDCRYKGGTNTKPSFW